MRYLRLRLQLLRLRLRLRPRLEQYQTSSHSFRFITILPILIPVIIHLFISIHRIRQQNRLRNAYAELLGQRLLRVICVNTPP
jgi:heme/copper-type cytochrome/quinol oxidase subunit 2